MRYFNSLETVFSCDDANLLIISLAQALDSIKKSVPKKSAGKDKEKSKAKPVSGFSQDDAKRLEKEVILDKLSCTPIKKSHHSFVLILVHFTD